MAHFLVKVGTVMVGFYGVTVGLLGVGVEGVQVGAYALDRLEILGRSARSILCAI